MLKIIPIAALAAAVVIAVLVFSMPPSRPAGAPDVRFTEFTPDLTEIKVGGSTNILFNVRNGEQRIINDSKVQIVIEPPSYQPYISISDPVVELPTMAGKDSRTGEQKVTLHANGLPAKEATYDVKGVLLVEGKQADVRGFELRIGS